MKKREPFILFFAFIIVNILFICPPISAIITDLNRPAYTGARANGMGNAFTALADDADSVLLNPAGLCQISNIQASFERFSPYKLAGEIQNDFLSIAIPLSNKKSKNLTSIGISHLWLLAPFYSEHTTIFSFSIAPVRKGLALGANLKYLNVGFSFGNVAKEYEPFFISDPLLKENIESDPLLRNDSLSNLNIFAFDLGMIYQFNNQLRLGLTFENIIKNKDSFYKNNDKITLPEAIRFGGAWTRQLSYNNESEGFIENLYIGSLTLSSDVFYDLFDGDPKSFHLGGELWGKIRDIKSMDFAIRSGLEIAGKDKIKKMPFLGLGIRYKCKDYFGIALDYSYSLSSYNVGESRMSFALVFPKAFWQKTPQNITDKKDDSQQMLNNQK